MECNDEMVQEHSNKLGKLEGQVEANTKDIDRHENIYGVMLNLSSTQTELLSEIKTQGKTLLRVVEDVDYLKDNAENKQTVERIHERVDALEHKDEKDAYEREKALKRWLLKGFGAIIFMVISGYVGVLLSLG